MTSSEISLCFEIVRRGGGRRGGARSYASVARIFAMT